MSNFEVAIVAAKRTAIGAFMGSLSGVKASDLGAIVIRDILKETKVKAQDIDEVILGQVLTAGQGQNPARQASIDAGLPEEATAFTLNLVCGSGLKSVMLGAQAVALGEAKIVLAGGQENMSSSQHSMVLRNGVKMGSGTMTDTMISDGLWDAFNDYHMGETAENVAEKYKLTREELDKFAFNSQSKAKSAIEEGKFKTEITPVEIPQRKGEAIIFQEDEHPRLAPLDKLAGLRTAFKKDGVVTAGNASGLNDGAAVVMLMSVEDAEQRSLEILGIIKASATCGVDPKIMGIAPISASRKVLEKAEWEAADLEIIEANEAFASQALAVNNEMGWDTEKVNVNGGAIALGHPIGASGTRCLVTLLHEMKRSDAKKGLVTLCIGGGQGVAMAIARN